MAKKSARQKRKRREKRGGGTVPQAPPIRQAKEPAAAAAERATRPASRRDQGPPPAPWGTFPLVELSTLIALIMLVGGFFFVDGERGGLMIGAGLVIGSLAGFELAVREHFAGYRSHTLILAGIPGVATMAGLSYLGPESLGPLIRVVIAGAVFGGVAFAATRLFQARSGGYSFKAR